MKVLRIIVVGAVLALSGCSTLSAVNWSSALPWNWFGAAVVVSEQGVGRLTQGTPMNEEAIGDGLGGAWRLRSGMKTANGGIVSFFEGMKDDRVALVINGDNGKVSRIEVLDKEIATADGVRVGTSFSELYDKAFGACEKGRGDESGGVICQAPGSQHISYLFTGNWHGPQGLMPSDDALKNWTLNKIIWRR